MVEYKDFIYLAVLFVSIPLAHVFKILPNPKVKQLYGGCLGFLIATVVCGSQVLHSLVAASVNYFFIRFVSQRYNHVLSFFFCFGYIGFTRVAYLFGLERVNDYANIIQLVLTVKLVSVAFDIHDGHKRKRQLKEGGHPEKSIPRNDNDPELIGFEMPEGLPIMPDIVEYYCYVYCFIGLLTGPFFRLCTFRHAVWRKDAATLQTFRASTIRLAPFPVYALINFLFSTYFSHKFMATAAYAALPYVQRVLYVLPAFIGFRYRYYAGWSLAEAAAVASGIGAYPAETEPAAGQGPTKKLTGKASGEIDFSTVHNLDVYRIETAKDMATAIRHWNMTVQWWMVHYIYRRFPLKSLRFFAVWFASAYWHGVHLGYYLCFMSTLLTSVAESSWWKATAYLRQKGPNYERALLVIGWLFCYRFFEHLAVGFMLRFADDVFKAWQLTYFFGHALAVLLLVVSLLIPQPRAPREKKE